jgi:GNAT superfamily N-acetyltransferase
MNGIIAFTAEDLPALPAFQPEGWSDIIPVFDFYLTAPFCRPVKAVADGSMVGIGSLILLPGGTAWLGHIVVRPEARRRGIGGGIVAGLLEKAAAAGCRTVSLIATEAGTPLYQKAGFTTQGEYVYLERPTAAPLFRTESTAAQPSDHEALFALDRRISGEDRRALLTEHLPQARIVQRMGKPVGMYLPGLGEGPVLAEEPQAGLALLAERGGASIRLPAENRSALAWGAANGYQETCRTRRMVHGVPFAWQPAALYTRISGNLG